MRVRTLRFLILPVAIMASALAGACDQEGPAEQAGEKVDEAVQGAGDALERAGDKAD